MSYRHIKGKHDRSLSVDIGNDIVTVMNHSKNGPTSDAKNYTQGRSTPKAKIRNQDSSFHHPDESNHHSNNNSPLKPLNMNHYFGSRSQNNSAVKGIASKAGKLERVASVYLNAHSEPENSVSKAIQIAFELQAEREKELSSSKERLEGEVNRLKLVTDSFQDKITTHRQNQISKGNNLRLLQILSDKGIADLEDLLIQDPAKRKELINVLSKINRSIINDYRALQNHNERRIDSIESTEGNISALISHPTVDILQNFLDDKNLLIHKVEQAEEKLNQAREIKNMIEEDFLSHVNSTTEYVFAQEEAENLLEALKYKYSGCFELVLQDVELERMCASLEIDYTNKFHSYANLSQQVSEEQIKHTILSEQEKDIMRTIESISESLHSISNEILFPLLPLQDRLSEAFKMIPLNSEEIKMKLLSFFSIFDASGRLNIYENSSLPEKDIGITYQNEVLEEVLTVLKFKKDILNLESTMFKLTNKGIQPDSENQVLKSIQTEIINKKVSMTQRISELELNKKKIVRSNFSLNGDYLVAHAETPFYELSKKYSSIFESAIVHKLEQVLLILLSGVKDNYGSYFSLKEAHIKNLEKSNLIQTDFKAQTRLLDSLQHALAKTKEELNIIKKNQESYKQKQIEIKDKFENVSQSAEKHNRGESSGYKDKTPSKSPSKGTSAISTPRKNTFTKVKREIQDAHCTIQKVEFMRQQNSNIIETQLRPNFERAKVHFVEYRSKIGFLNKEVIVLIDREQEFFRGFERQMYEAGLLTTNEEEYVILSRLYLSTQDYITGLCELMCTILQTCFMEERPERSVSINKSEVYEILSQQQERLKMMMDVDNKKIQEYELQLKTQMPVLFEREEKLAFIKDQLQKSKHFCEVTDQLMKTHDKENCFSSSNNNSFINSSGKKLVSNKSLSKLGINTKENSSKKVITPGLRLNFDLGNSKSQNENKLMNIFANDSTSGRLVKNPSSANISPYSSQTRFTPTERTGILKEAEAFGSNTSKVEIGKSVQKYLYIEPNRYLDAIRDFELGFPLYKKFSGSSNLYSNKSELTRQQSQELKGYGKRTFRVNIVQKTVEVIKVNTVGSRPQVEYSYEWKNLKKLFIPSKTLECLKRAGGINREGREFLAFAIDVNEKGRVDFISTNPFYIVVLWNFVNQILSNGVISA